MTDQQIIDMSGEVTGQWSTKWQTRDGRRVMIHTTTAPGQYPVIFSTENIHGPNTALPNGKVLVIGDNSFDLIPIPPPKKRYWVSFWVGKNTAILVTSSVCASKHQADNYLLESGQWTYIKTIEVEL